MNEIAGRLPSGHAHIPVGLIIGLIVALLVVLGLFYLFRGSGPGGRHENNGGKHRG